MQALAAAQARAIERTEQAAERMRELVQVVAEDVGLVEKIISGLSRMFRLCRHGKENYFRLVQDVADDVGLVDIGIASCWV